MHHSCVWNCDGNINGWKLKSKSSSAVIKADLFFSIVVRLQERPFFPKPAPMSWNDILPASVGLSVKLQIAVSISLAAFLLSGVNASGLNLVKSATKQESIRLGSLLENRKQKCQAYFGAIVREYCVRPALNNIKHTEKQVKACDSMHILNIHLRSFRDVFHCLLGVWSDAFLL